MTLPIPADRRCDWCTGAPALDGTDPPWFVIPLTEPGTFAVDGGTAQDLCPLRLTCPACLPLVEDAAWPEIADRAIAARLRAGMRLPPHARSEILSLFLRLGPHLGEPVFVALTRTT